MLMAHKHTHTQQKVTHLHVHSWETHGDRSELKIYFIKNRSQLKFVKKRNGIDTWKQTKAEKQKSEHFHAEVPRTEKSLLLFFLVA